MVVVLKPDAQPETAQALGRELEREYGVRCEIVEGAVCRVLNLVGDTSGVDGDRLSMRECVERVIRIGAPYVRAGRSLHPADTAVDVSGVPVGGGHFTVMAGPCSVESEAQLTAAARAVKERGASILRGGAFKPRTSPYSFQGMGPEGIELLARARAETGLPVVSELMSPKYCEIFEEKVDLVQIGARNMQNYDLLREVGKMSRPVLLKRGMASSYEEWLMSAEYIMAAGNERVILCERGIRTFESCTRNTLDLSAVPAVKRMSHLPVVVDPSHASGLYWMVEPLALAALAAGADGIMVEVHPDPACARSDGQQSLTPERFGHLMDRLRPMAALLNKTM